MGVDPEICICGARMIVDDAITDGEKITEILARLGRRFARFNGSAKEGFCRDSANERNVVEYLTRFDREIGKVMTAVPKTTDLVVVGDHGMSAIGSSLNARKILGEDIAGRGHIETSGGSMYFYPPADNLSTLPPADLDREKIAQKLRKMDFEVTNQKILTRVLVRGSKETP